MDTARTPHAVLHQVVHDLNNLLTCVLGFARLAQRNDMSPHAKENLESVVDAVHSMQELTSDMLVYGELQEGTINVRQERLSLRECVDSAKSTILIDPAMHIFECRVASIEVVADGHCVKRILRNLIENAIKYSPSGGTVTVSARYCGGEYVQVDVEDEGIGIPRESTTRLFTPYFRGHASQGNIPGTGLGLVVVKDLVERHGGRVWVEPREGRGTKVAFTLPAV